MSPTRTSLDGTFRFDRIFRGVGRITLSSGTRRLAEFRRRDALLTKLWNQGRLDLLRSLAEKRLTIQDLVLADREERLGAMASELLGRRPLWPQVEAITGRYRRSWDALKRAGVLSPTASVTDLAKVDWIGLERAWGKSSADWNHLRRAVSRFLTLALEDKWHPLRRKVMAHFPIRIETDREPDLTVEDFIRTTTMISEPLRPAFWTIAITGLRIGEFCALTRLNLRPKSHTVQVPGSKTKGSTRELPVDPRLWSWIERAVPCPVTHWHLRNVWRIARKAAGIGDVRLHDLRHAMAQWSTDAGADLPMIQAQLGHATVQMTGRYAKRKLRAQHAKIMGDLLSVPQPVTQRANAK
jgi:integrase